MKILVAEDEPVSGKRLELTLRALGHEVTVTRDGEAAWQTFQAGRFPMVITDWVMPGVDGLELVRRVRAGQEGPGDYTWMILLTGREDGMVEGLEAGADDFIPKPCAPAELRARIEVGRRVLGIKAELAARVRALEATLEHVRRLEGLLPICSYCKNIRDKQDAWHSVEEYVAQRSQASFSHSICPTCYRQHVAPLMAEHRKKNPPPAPPGG
ncbi:MAG: response regulator transcription factor [Planctomycetes bacterium]|nr:response regulator transcription factor [Planctomycetota bacterium]